MTNIEPLKAVIYNQAKFADFYKLTCPPYDVISPKDKRLYSKLSPYNIIHLTLPKSKGDRSFYSRSRRTFKDWLRNKILIQEKEPAIYFYEQRFSIDNQKHRRIGFIANLRLNDESIFGHEHTRIGPKEDRFKLLKKVKANLEPIFVIFSDPQNYLIQIYKKFAILKSIFTPPLRAEAGFIHFRDKQNIENTLWRISSPSAIKTIKRLMHNKDIFIADGHHRYEVSLKYCALMRKRLKMRFTGKEDFNYIMAYFCPIQSDGLLLKSSFNLRQIIHLAKLGKRLPSKSTYFYPKVLSGLVINKFNEDKS